MRGINRSLRLVVMCRVAPCIGDTCWRSRRRTTMSCTTLGLRVTISDEETLGTGMSGRGAAGVTRSWRATATCRPKPAVYECIMGSSDTTSTCNEVAPH